MGPRKSTARNPTTRAGQKRNRRYRLIQQAERFRAGDSAADQVKSRNAVPNEAAIFARPQYRAGIVYIARLRDRSTAVIETCDAPLGHSVPALTWSARNPRREPFGLLISR